MTICIQNKQLEVRIEEPGTQYMGSRFDWSGQVVQITYLQKHTFGSFETGDPNLQSISGHGFCNEFGIETCIGYDDCETGDYFPKIGVGLLQKETEDPYFFFTQYPVRPAEFSVTRVSSGELHIHSGIDPYRGYGYRLLKKYRIFGNSLFMDYELENTGTRILATEEYNHNFSIVDHIPVGDSYQLKFPQIILQENIGESVNPMDLVHMKGTSVTWAGTPDTDFFFSTLAGSEGPMNSWAVENTKAGVGFRESCDCHIVKCNLWGKGHVISPELFVHLAVSPGQKTVWARRYDFYEL